MCKTYAGERASMVGLRQEVLADYSAGFAVFSTTQ